MVNLILPTLIISFLSVFTFYLPAESQEKITLGISLLLSLIVFLGLIVKKFLPPTSLVFPLIAKYLLFTLVINLASVAATIYVSSVSFKYLEQLAIYRLRQFCPSGAITTGEKCPPGSSCSSS